MSAHSTCSYTLQHSLPEHEVRERATQLLDPMVAASVDPAEPQAKSLLPP